ncbi:ABC-type Fe3+/spermidine/putrescine transport system ATPase subunit [Paraburkholderia sp. JPY465]|uniref:hypothetical protein n=1 Tax=Paraburkholderia sp. JPY465 TaxID=3042285 RepID=UPI003D1EFDDA
MVTHDQEEALTMSVRVVVMNHGRILQSGTPNEVYDRPRTGFVAEFLGAANILPFSVVRAERNWLDIAIRDAPGDVRSAATPTCRVAHALNRPLAAGASGEVAVRPEKLRVGDPRPDDIRFDGVVAARRSAARSTRTASMRPRSGRPSASISRLRAQRPSTRVIR